MTLPRPLPSTGSIFLDARGVERALRVTWHSEHAMVVLSLWRENVCTGTFRLDIEEVPVLIGALRAGLDQAYAAGRPSAARSVERAVERSVEYRHAPGA